MTQIEAQPKMSATRVGVLIVGIIGGLVSMEHGFFETLQGNTPTNGVLIDAIGPADRFWESGRELALTIIPNFLISGICAIIVGVFVIVWSVGFVHGRYGALVYSLLQIIQLLVGGGVAFFALGLMMSIAATRIDRPLTWWRKHVPVKARRILGKLWLWLLLPAVTLFSLLVLAAIFGVWFLDADTTISSMGVFGYISLGLMIVAIIAGIARDSCEPTDI